MNNNRSILAYVLCLLLGVVTSASAAAPIDMEDAGTELAGYVGGAATAGLVVFVALLAIRVILKAFRGVAR